MCVCVCTSSYECHTRGFHPRFSNPSNLTPPSMVNQPPWRTVHQSEEPLRPLITKTQNKKTPKNHTRSLTPLIHNTAQSSHIIALHLTLDLAEAKTRWCHMNRSRWTQEGYLSHSPDIYTPNASVT